MMSRRDLLSTLGTAGIAACGAGLTGAEPPTETSPPKAADRKMVRIGVISPAKHVLNGHTWHFAQYLHPTCDFDALKKHYPRAVPNFTKLFRNPKRNFDELPFPDTQITHYYQEGDAKVAGMFAETFPGVQVATDLEQMVQEVDAIWLGDANSTGEGHFPLVAPGLARGLPTFCDKPIGGSVAGTKQILDLARKHQAPLMSGSIFNHEWGMEAALRMRDSGEFGPLEHVSSHLYGHLNLTGWMIYGQHPVWSVMRLMGAGVEAVSMYLYEGTPPTCHALITYPDRYPCRVWCGQPYEKFEYNRTDVYFRKKQYSFTPSIEGDYDFGYHYQMFRLAATFRQMVLTRQEPAPHQEILEVTAIIHAAAKSLKEQGRLVKLAEVLG
jgi:predicted dehydrogenase